MREVAVLFARSDSVYKTLPGCDVFDAKRDARTWQGGAPLVAHPECGPWGQLHMFSKATPEEKAFGPWAVEQVRRWGGVLEHPAKSKLWGHCGLPMPYRGPDDFGGWTLEIRQCDWGHRAEKLTWLYVVGVHPDDLPAMPPRAEPTAVIKPRRDAPRDSRKIVTKRERDATPPALAEFLVELARLTRIDPRLRRGHSLRDGLFRSGPASAAALDERPFVDLVSVAPAPAGLGDVDVDPVAAVGLGVLHGAAMVGEGAR